MMEAMIPSQVGMRLQTSKKIKKRPKSPNKKREKENIEAYRKQYTIMYSNKKQIE